MLIPRQWDEPNERDTNGHRWHFPYWAGAWPTVSETLNVIAAMRADAVLQILRGDAVYYGLGSAVRSES